MDTTSPARIAGIYRYPVKGLTPEQLSRAELKPGQTLLADRRYAIENGPSGFDPAEPKWLPKPHFLMLMRDEWLAGLRTRFDDATNVLSINHNGRIVAQGNLATARGPADDRRLLRLDLSRPDQGTAKGSRKPGPQLFGCRPQGRLHHQSRQRPRHRDHGGRAGPSACASAPTSMSRAGRPGTNSTSLDRMLAIGDVRLKVVKRIVRCAAVNVDPDTAQRDLAIPQALQRRLGHADCGIYAEVIEGGTHRRRRYDRGGSAGVAVNRRLKDLVARHCERATSVAVLIA